MDGLREEKGTASSLLGKEKLASKPQTLQKLAEPLGLNRNGDLPKKAKSLGKEIGSAHALAATRVDLLGPVESSNRSGELDVDCVSLQSFIGCGSGPYRCRKVVPEFEFNGWDPIVSDRGLPW